MISFKEFIKDKENIDKFIDKNELILFFKKNDSIFGAPEDSRVIFAKLKSDDDDMPTNWKDEANFIAMNLMSSLDKDPVENMFSYKDLNDIKVLDKDTIVNLIINQKCGE